MPALHIVRMIFFLLHIFIFSISFQNFPNQLVETQNIVTKIIALDSNVDSLLIRHLSAYEKRSIFQRLVDPEIKLAVHHLTIQMRQKERYGVTTIKSFLRQSKLFIKKVFGAKSPCKIQQKIGCACDVIITYPLIVALNSTFSIAYESTLKQCNCLSKHYSNLLSNVWR